MPDLGARQVFADQFEEEGDNFLFRPDSNGPAIRVSAEEYQAFIRNYNRYYCFSSLGIVGAVLVMGLLIFVMLARQGHLTDFLKMFIGGLIVIAAVSVPFSRRAFNAPRRALSGRATVIERTYPDIRR